MYYVFRYLEHFGTIEFWCQFFEYEYLLAFPKFGMRSGIFHTSVFIYLRAGETGVICKMHIFLIWSSVLRPPPPLGNHFSRTHTSLRHSFCINFVFQNMLFSKSLLISMRVFPFVNIGTRTPLHSYKPPATLQTRPNPLKCSHKKKKQLKQNENCIKFTGKMIIYKFNCY